MLDLAVAAKVRHRGLSPGVSVVVFVAVVVVVVADYKIKFAGRTAIKRVNFGSSIKSSENESEQASVS